MVEERDSKTEAECACAGGCDSGEGQPEHRWGELCCGGKVGAEGGADKWESVEAAFSGSVNLAGPRSY